MSHTLALKSVVYMKICIIIGWAGFNRHHVVLVISKKIKTNPESPPQIISTILETPPNYELSPCANYKIR